MALFQGGNQFWQCHFKGIQQSLFTAIFK